MHYNGSLVMIRDQKGRILFQLRDDKPTISWPGHWILPGGQQEPGETWEETALREVKEETGLTLTAVQQIKVRVSPPDTHPPAVFYAVWDGNDEELVIGEGQALEWFDVDSFPQPIPAPVTDYITQVLESIS